MHVFTIPEDITPKHPLTGEPFRLVDPVTGEQKPQPPVTFVEYATGAWLANPKIAENLEELERLINHIIPSFRGKKAGDQIRIEDSDKKLVDRMAKEKPDSTNAMYAALFVGWHRAWLDSKPESA